MAGAVHRLVAVLVLAGACALLAGCGGGKKTAATTTTGATTTTTTHAMSKSAYVAAMKQIGQSLDATLNGLSAAATPAKAATALVDVQRGLRGAGDRLASITPPPSVRVLHARLVKGLRDFADELGPIIAKLRKGQASALAAVPSLKGLREVQSASTAISKKGFAISG